MSPLLTFVLLPLAWLYAGVAAVRNWLYDTGLLAATGAAVPLINVGNLRVGGTGKTPHVAWVVELLRNLGQQPAILSRGYGRGTKGFRLARPTDTAATIGDEPWQHFHEFGGAVPVAVDEDRRHGLAELAALQLPISAVVLDDAYQHRRVQPTLNILLTEQARPFWHDYVLPAGRLRESRRGARRADVVIVTKCPPQWPETAQHAAAEQVRRYARPDVLVLFSSYIYGRPVPVSGALTYSLPTSGSEVLVLTGIAQPEPLLAYLREAGYRVVRHMSYADHHAFTSAELAEAAAVLQPGQVVLTTQKDAARLREPHLRTAVASLPLFYVPIRVSFLADGAERLHALLMPLLTPQPVA
ncbi:tetraacyldisaccharide 4'-kinase [Hymenobacter busanensis]|uniref:Tetraacyldisaccharide 4'-kinase n=1 Tax=Hymenobacter busanensis TaxID=2607656 RepID=A0A7L4ZSG1_9BACT|nr:tetraacyldisaccharide 4'-kinase [Hymenobacter busanensis]KAA9325906.1 tetraacyldisaccharide 4'-kinase [Hymenobacter busanensis]QHJ06254.1 tetraacyldisaccharide 4'-kinase [Hymenobacter busanensis]